MDKKDLEEIRGVFREEFTHGFGQIWEHNLEPAFEALESTMQALDSKVKNYLELSDKRYLELKRKNLILVKWVTQLAEKTGVSLDLKELEEFK